ncbi:HAD family hydrolase [Ferruginibacter sp.]
MKQYKNIIFDLGNVLLDIDYNKTVAAFEDLGFANFKSNYTPLKMDVVFEQLETGQITGEEFCSRIKAISKTPLTDQQITDAWNALFLSFRLPSLAYLEQLAGQYQLYLFSNTNSIHYTAFESMFIKDTGKKSLDDYFTKAYYSHLIGHRKPEVAAYNYVVQDAGIKAEETLFIDDLPNNIEGARLAGLGAHLLLPHERIENLGLA